MRSKLSAFLFLLVLSGNSVFSQSLDGFIVIGNNTGVKALSRLQLKRIFEGNFGSIWKTGHPLLVVMPTAKCEFSSQFAEKILNRTYPSLQKIWLAQVFQGRSAAPVFKNSAGEILEYVKVNPGSVAVIKMEEKDVPDELIIQVTDR